MMVVSRVIVCLSLICALPLHAQLRCDPEGLDTLKGKALNIASKPFLSEPKMTEMQLYLGAPLPAVQQKLMVAMLACNMPAGSVANGEIASDFGDHLGGLLSVRYHTVTHIYLLAVSDSLTVLRFSGLEDIKEAGKTGTQRVRKIDNKASGRALEAWLAMRNVFKQLLTDPTLKADRAKSTPLALTVSGAS